MADRAHSTGRRALLAGLGATTLMYLPVHANGVHPDVDLLARAPELGRLAHAEDEAIEVAWALEARAHELADSRAAKLTREWTAALAVAEDEVGFTAAEAALARAARAVTEAANALVLIPARTLEGLCMKARFAEHSDDLGESIVDDLIAIGRAMTA
ncbi:hypothetical protein E4V01_07725 [Methylorubrum sp. Q1]|uniref:hypothetical protein n=1 Tax=Methylorubrum sp. Q1 TaxID=2562453 RepID=UPI001076378F|nr:hypothetical protein [Methylorubrum sp. Q1]TFZ59330.1 hypothetical protein E4V01_07725 [Methylorubrum sp. Q1]